MTIGENVRYGTGKARASESRKKPVRCIETGEVFASAKEAAAAVNGDLKAITRCCTGK